MAAVHFQMVRLLILLAVFTVIPLLKPAEAGILDDIDDVFKSIEDLSCPVEHKDAIDSCKALSYPFYELQASFENDNQKEKCCSRLAAYGCMSSVTKAYCGEMGKFIASFATVLDKIIASDQCDAYTSIYHCTHPVTFFIIFFIIFSIIAFIIKCIYICGSGMRHSSHFDV